MSQEFQQQPTGQHQGGEHQPMGGGMQGQQQQPAGGGMQGQGQQQPMTEQIGGQPMGGQIQHIPKFEDHLTTELRTALEDFDHLTHVAEWCAVECTRAGPQLADCARICEDIAELAELNEKLIARNSMFGPEVAEAFLRVAQEGIRELQQYQQSHPHVDETIAAIDRAITSCTTLLEMVGQQGQQMGGTQGQQQMGGMQGQQPMGGGQMGGM